MPSREKTKIDQRTTNTGVRPQRANGTPKRRPKRLTFFVGKGGVGKTTVSAAFALQLARERGEEVVLVSSDPAHSLADVFSLKLGNTPRVIPGGLTVWQIDAQREFKKFLTRNRTALVESLEKGTLFTAHELNSFLDASFPGMAELGVLLALHALLHSSKNFSHIVVDTAPFGHTLRLFQIPEQLRKLLDLIELAEQRDTLLAQSFGGRATAQKNTGGIVSKLREMLDSIQVGLSRENAETVLVTTPEKFSLNEAQRVSDDLQRSAVPLSFNRIVLNRAIRVSGRCKACATRRKKTQQAITFLKKHFPRAICLPAEDAGIPILGVHPLLNFGRHILQRKKLSAVLAAQETHDIHTLPLRRAEWPMLDKALTFTLGKGGVGKTTVSATCAFHARKTIAPNGSGKSRSSDQPEVVICSTDPAPSLDDIFHTQVGRQPISVLGDPGLFAVDADSVALLKAWTKRLEQQLQRFVRGEQSGVHIELSFEHDFLRGLLDLVPPGVDEIFATFEILRLIENGGKESKSQNKRGPESRERRLVIDMAPTGHALELLRTPDRLLNWSRLLLKALSSHRHLGIVQEIAVELAEVSQQANRLLHLMHDSRQSQILVVMLAELLPDRETQRLLQQLKELKLTPAAVFVNRVILHPSAGCRRCGRAAASQHTTLFQLIRKIKAVPVYLLPEMPDEPTGKDGLNQLSASIHKLGKSKDSTERTY